MADIDDPLERMEEELRRRHPDREFDYSRMPAGEDEDEWLVIDDEDGLPVAGIDFKPRLGGFGVTRPTEDLDFPDMPDKFFEGESAYDDALEEVEKILEEPGPAKKR